MCLLRFVQRSYSCIRVFSALRASAQKSGVLGQGAALLLLHAFRQLSEAKQKTTRYAGGKQKV